MRVSTLLSRLDGPYTAPVLVTCILLAGHVSYGILESYERTLLAIGVAIGAEIALSLIFRKQWPRLASAYISGISVGMILRSPEFWPYVVCSLLTISSKYVLRVNDRHIWNPSNFGICAMLFLAPFHVAHLSIQWGNDLWAMAVIWLLGSVIIYRLHKFHISLTYVTAFLAFAALRSLLTGDPLASEVAPLTGPMYQLFVFFMITDPKTIVSSTSGQVLVAVLIALVESMLRLFEVVHAPFYALFLVGPTALLIDMALRSRRPALVTTA